MKTFLFDVPKKIGRSQAFFIANFIGGLQRKISLLIKDMAPQSAKPKLVHLGPWDQDSDKEKNEKGPWGKNNQNDSKKTPNIDDTIDKLQQRFKKTFNQGGGEGPTGLPSFSPSFIGLVIGVVLVMWGVTGFYRVQEGELGVVTRFGEMVRISSPGLRYHLPAPMENVIVTKVAAVNIINGGMRGNKVSEETSEKTLILTGDENMVHTNYTVLWKIKDVKDFLFNARQPEITIKVAAESVIREVIGQTTAKSALTEGRDVIESKAQVLLQKLMDQYKLGVEASVQLQNVAPPQEVVESFNGLQSSLTNADRLSNEAETFRRDILPRAQGQAIQILQEAEAYRQTRIAEAEGEVARFSPIYLAYQANPRLVIKRKYLEVMDEVLSEVKDKIIIDPKVGNNIVPYLPLKDGVKAASKANEKIVAATQTGAQK